ncbi:DUF732 domain-containing protein [Mycobacterium sp. 94-17]|uniref:DUF732 domain-containing protein n=1 Tax=Mycobacterium sp. 94-17 TaxID=2986147 RepID=UPI002D1F3D10|nr:DUF732 domain-containing protein [Mycobacterium sp. 94-17]MEB4211219.1 DUF732 domain-containing protein [Mycobacterium sp. 94-17]
MTEENRRHTSDGRILAEIEGLLLQNPWGPRGGAPTPASWINIKAGWPPRTDTPRAARGPRTRRSLRVHSAVLAEGPSPKLLGGLSRPSFVAWSKKLSSATAEPFGTGGEQIGEGEGDMESKRRCSKFLGVALAGGLLIFGIVCSGPALADENAYLNDLHNDGVHAMSGGDPTLVQLGWNMCGELSNGVAPEQLKSEILQQSDTEQGARGISDKQANDIVKYAMTDLCSAGT